MIPIDTIFDIPVKRFTRLQSESNCFNTRIVYLLNSPIRGMAPEISQNKIAIGNSGNFYYLNNLTYNIGYLFEIQKINTAIYHTHICMGAMSDINLMDIGEISTLYMDENILVLQNKKHSSYMVLSTDIQNIPQPEV